MPKMRVAQIPYAKGPFELVERDIPDPAVGQVRIKVEACGVCHSDSVTKQGLMPGITYPRVPGHEVIGRIDAIGPGVAGWTVGQRAGVVAEIYPRYAQDIIRHRVIMRERAVIGRERILLFGDPRTEGLSEDRAHPSALAWLNRCRRLAKDWENLNRNALAFLNLASIRLMLRKLCNPC